jgi:hypothetical protein
MDQLKAIKNYTSTSQEEIKHYISAIRSCQEEFEEKMTDKLDKQPKGIVNVVEKQTQGVRR